MNSKRMAQTLDICDFLSFQKRENKDLLIFNKKGKKNPKYHEFVRAVIIITLNSLQEI